MNDDLFSILNDESPLAKLMRIQDAEAQREVLLRTTVQRLLLLSTKLDETLTELEALAPCSVQSIEALRWYLAPITAHAQRISHTNALFLPSAGAGCACDVGGVPRAARQ